jgi:hypothetical protein
MHPAWIGTLLLTLLCFSSSTSFAQGQEPPKKDEPKQPAEPTQPGEDIEMGDKHDEQKKTEEVGAKSPARQEMEPGSESPKKEDDDDPDKKKFTLSGYVETFYQYNFNNPGNGISNYRGFDNRHNTLTLSNAVLDAGFRAKDILGRLALQVGHTPASLYQQETRLPGSDGAGETDDKLWRHLQRASIGWQATKSMLFEAGLFLTNIGVESLAVKDNWNWSRTNAFVRLPNYQTGVKATFHASDRLDLSGGVFNGWNTVVDNNDEKSFLLQGQYKVKEQLSASLAYFGGVEREGGAPEGRRWRHAFDSYVQIDATSWFQVAGEGSGGWEANRFGLHWFAGAAAYARMKTLDWLYVALRGDRLWEDPSASASGMSRPFMVPVKHVTSGTATLDARPVKGLSLRVEYRHDRAEGDLYFKGQVEGDGSPEKPYVPNTKIQNTVLAGAVAWF